MAKCINCDRKIGFSTSSYNLLGGNEICFHCYESIPSFSTNISYRNLEHFDNIVSSIINEMKERNFKVEATNAMQKHLVDFRPQVELACAREAYQNKYQNVTINDVANLMKTTTDSFNGYRISKYVTIVSTTQNTSVEVINELARLTIANGGNAMVGVNISFNERTFGEYNSNESLKYFGTATCVTIEKIITK